MFMFEFLIFFVNKAENREWLLHLRCKVQTSQRAHVWLCICQCVCVCMQSCVSVSALVTSGDIPSQWARERLNFPGFSHLIDDNVALFFILSTFIWGRNYRANYRTNYSRWLHNKAHPLGTTSRDCSSLETFVFQSVPRNVFRCLQEYTRSHRYEYRRAIRLTKPLIERRLYLRTALVNTLSSQN